MKFDLTLALADKPGQLLRALEPIAKNGGNIISIIHERDKPVEGYVPVSLVVDFPSRQNFRSAINDLRSLGIAIIKSEEVVEKVRLTFILIGGVDLRRVIESNIRDVRIIGVKASTPKLNEVSVKLDIEFPADRADEVMEELRRLSKEQNAILISPI
ncbi:ACT domain-containing protein [Candidatus Bathyarchaeota archaeon]|nr:ACT domain-containing protein [Candidatus Bathyarchaeota archaeon]